MTFDWVLDDFLVSFYYQLGSEFDMLWLVSMIWMHGLQLRQLDWSSTSLVEKGGRKAEGGGYTLFRIQLNMTINKKKNTQIKYRFGV